MTQEPERVGINEPFVHEKIKRLENYFDPSCIYHFWTGGMAEEGYAHDPFVKNILCFHFPQNRKPCHDGTVHVTINRDLITCQECLELIHS